MASILLKRALLSAPSRRLQLATARAVGPAAVGNRSFSANSMRDLDDYEDDRNLDRRPESGVDRRRAVDPSAFGEVFDPLNPSRSLSQVLNLMDQMLDNPFAAGVIPWGAYGGLRRGWNVREDKDALHLRVDMPGLGKEHVKVWAEQNTLIIKGEGEKEPGEADDNEGGGRRYSSRIELPSDSFKMDDIRAELKNGVLKVVVPKVKQEERKGVFPVKIE